MVQNIIDERLNLFPQSLTVRLSQTCSNPIWFAWNNLEITEAMAYGTFTKNAISRPLVSVFAQTWTLKACKFHEFLADLQDSCVKNQLKSSRKGSLDQVSIQLIVILQLFVIVLALNQTLENFLRHHVYMFFFCSLVFWWIYQKKKKPNPYIIQNRKKW